MSLTWEKNGVRYALSESSHNISIPIKFSGDSQPSHFGANAAERKPMRSGGFIGDVSQGGSCNAFEITINPHCNGTHTETSWHLTEHGPSTYEKVSRPFYLSALITVTPQLLGEESYSVKIQPDEQVITRKSIEFGLKNFSIVPEAIVIRTLPNPQDKKSRSWSEQGSFPFLTIEAAELLVELGVHHLIVDVPSVDRSDDDGKLAVHKKFFAGSGQTVSEMAFISDKIEDGVYALRYGVISMENDASPSSIYLHKLEEL